MKPGWEQADVVVEGTYEVPFQEHAYLQPEAGLSYIDELGRVTVEIAGQWTIEDQGQIAHALDLPMDQVRVIYPAIGGAFGGREDQSLQIVLALAAIKLRNKGINRPIRSQWSREESIVGHHKRHRGRVHTRWGAKRTGELVAIEADAWLDAGGYNYTTNKVLGNLHRLSGRTLRSSQCPDRQLRHLHQCRSRRRVQGIWGAAGGAWWPRARSTNWRKHWAWTRSRSGCATPSAMGRSRSRERSCQTSCRLRR